MDFKRRDREKRDTMFAWKRRVHQSTGLQLRFRRRERARGKEKQIKWGRVKAAILASDKFCSSVTGRGSEHSYNSPRREGMDGLVQSRERLKGSSKFWAKSEQEKETDGLYPPRKKKRTGPGCANGGSHSPKILRVMEGPLIY